MRPTTWSWSPPTKVAVPSARFMASACVTSARWWFRRSSSVASGPSSVPRNSPAMARPRAVSWRTVVSSSGIAALGSTRRMISMVSPASIACACSRSPRALMVMPVRACRSSSRSMARGATWLTSSITSTVLRVGRNSPLSTAASRGVMAKPRSMPAPLSSRACFQAVASPTTSRPPGS